jgi:hypothetical protein
MRSDNLSSQLPSPRIAPAVETRDYDDPMLLNFKEYSVRKPPHTRTPTASVNDKLQRVFRYCLNCCFDRQRKTLTKLRTNVVVPGPSVQQILIRLWGPDDRQPHGFFNRPDLTCSQGMTSEGFCSCRVIR